MPTQDWNSDRASRTVALLGVVLGLSAGLLIAAAALSHPAPRVGDIVSFAPNDDPGMEDGTRLLVHRSGQFGCVLDLNVLRQSGGSLVIESQFAPSRNTYRLHWAGQRTSADSANCGADADLIVDKRDLVVLAVAAAQPRQDLAGNPTGTVPGSVPP